MLPVAVSTAEAVRISNYLAIGSRTKATISIKGALIIAHCSIIPVGLLVFFNRYEIIGVFTDNKELISLASPLFTAILIFQMQDDQCLHLHRAVWLWLRIHGVYALPYLFQSGTVQDQSLRPVYRFHGTLHDAAGHGVRKTAAGDGLPVVLHLGNDPLRGHLHRHLFY